MERYLKFYERQIAMGFVIFLVFFAIFMIAELFK